MVRATATERVGQELPSLHDPEAAATRVAELAALPLTMESAGEVALLNNHRLQAELEALGIARGGLIGAVLPPNPDLHLETFTLESPLDGNLELGVSENLSDVLRMPLAIAAANADLQAAHQEAAGVVLDMLYDARAAWVRHAAASQKVEMHETVLSAASAAFNVSMRMNLAGNLSDLEATQERLLFEDARLARDRATLEAFSTRQDLGVMLGLPPDTPWTLGGQLPEPDEASSPQSLADLEQQALENSLDLGALDAQYKAAARRAHLALANGLLPELRVGISAERAGGEWELGPAFGAELPVFSQGQGQIMSARAEARRIEHLGRDQSLKVLAAVRVANEAVETARARALQMRDVLLPLHEDVVAETLLLYNGMLVGVFRLLDAKRMQVEAEGAYIASLQDYWLARIELDKLLAGRMPDSGASATPGPSGPAPSSRSGGH
jgi:cobalt-zinc-cadmium efflux system outer membrane protein